MNINYVVLSYPSISAQHLERIQQIREVYDRQFDLIMPHFTLVFPTSKPSEDEITEHTKDMLTNYKRILFTVHDAKVVKDSFSGIYQVHLVINKGNSDMVRIHDVLYTGPLQSELRTDLPYTPHITVADCKDEAAANRLVNILRSENLQIEGSIEAIDVVSYDGKQVSTVKQFHLAK